MTRRAGAALLAGVVLVVAFTAVRAEEPKAELAIRITSPLGRTGIQGPIRVVAQVRRARDAQLQPVKFFVDQKAIGEASQGPPYAVEWTDENPYEAREIAAEVCDQAGTCARDSVKLEPLVILEETAVSSVLLEASVYDKNGKSIGGLSAGDFKLYEDDVEQRLDLVRTETVDSTYTLLVDSSQSMSRRLDLVQSAAGRLLGHLRPHDRVIVAPFTKKVGVVTGPTDDRATVLEAIGAIRAEGGTAIVDALADLPKLLEGAAGRQAVVLITDGYDENSARNINDAARAVKEAQATLYVVGIGGIAGISLKGERLLKDVANDSGGRAFFPSRDEELDTVHAAIAADVSSRYLLAYTPTNSKVDGAWRAIRLETADTANKIRTRNGYFAPKPPPVRATLEFTVANRERQPVEVAGNDLEIVEDGVPQALESFQEAVAPISIVLALDASGSMKGALDAVKQGAKQFIAALRPQDKLSLVLFSDEASMVHDLTTKRDSTVAAVDEYQVHGGTALNDALFESLTRLKSVEGRRAVVVLTDGRDENGPGTGPGSRHSFEDVLEQLKSVDVSVFAIGLGSNVEHRVLETVADESGGESFFPEAVNDLADDYQRVIEHLRQRYVATYVSSNAVRDGKWRTVTINIPNPQLMVKSRGGYFAPPE